MHDSGTMLLFTGKSHFLVSFSIRIFHFQFLFMSLRFIKFCFVSFFAFFLIFFLLHFFVLIQMTTFVFFSDFYFRLQRLIIINVYRNMTQSEWERPKQNNEKKIGKKSTEKQKNYEKWLRYCLRYVFSFSDCEPRCSFFHAN